MSTGAAFLLGVAAAGIPSVATVVWLAFRWLRAEGAASAARLQASAAHAESAEARKALEEERESVTMLRRG